MHDPFLIVHSVAELQQNIDIKKEYILYNPYTLSGRIFSELKSFALLSKKLGEKGYGVIFWIDTDVYSRVKFAELLSEHSDEFDFSALWLNCSKADFSLIPLIKLVFTSHERDLDLIFPGVYTANFNHAAGSIESNSIKTIEQIHAADSVNPEGYDNSCMSNLICDLFALPTYRFIASSELLYQAKFFLKEFEGVLPKCEGRKIYYDLGYLRSEGYKLAHYDELKEKNLLFAPRYLPNNNELFDHFEIISTLSRNLPDCTIFYRPFPGDITSEYCQDVFRKCSEFKNVRFDEFVIGTNLAKLYNSVSVLLTDRSSNTVSFTLATNRPAIQVDKYKESRMGGCLHCYSIEDLIPVVKDALYNNVEVGRKMSEELLKYMRPLGGTIDYIYENIENMIAGKPLPDSIEIDLGKEGGFTTYRQYYDFLVERIRSNFAMPNYNTEGKVVLSQNYYYAILRMLKFMLLKDIPQRAGDMSALEVITGVVKEYFEHLDLRDNNTYLYFSFSQYLELLVMVGGNELSKDEKIKLIDEHYREVLSKCVLREKNFQSDFYSFCEKMIKDYPDNTLCRSWLYQYLKSPVVEWMKEDNVFSGTYYLYYIRAAIWVGNINEAVDIFFRFLNFNSAMVLNPYCYGGSWNYDEYMIFINAILADSHKWDLKQSQVFSQILLNVISHSKKPEQLSALLNGLIKNAEVLLH